MFQRGLIMNKINIAIDGPAGAGKSTIAKLVAGLLGYIYIDTGAMYRAITLKVLDKGLDMEDEDGIGRMVQETDIELKYNEEGTQIIFLDGQNVSEAIRSPRVTQKVSQISQIAVVRTELVELQKRLARKGGVVMDGRDIGTYVLPEAECKIFLTASVEERAKRRHDELILKGVDVEYTQLKEEIALRDKMDSEREFAPLRQADNAICIDSTGMNIQQVTEKIISLAESKIEKDKNNDL